MYWTGYVFEGNRAFWPEELTTWTAGSLLLAVAALGGDEATIAVFGGERLPTGLEPDCCAPRGPTLTDDGFGPPPHVR